MAATIESEKLGEVFSPMNTRSKRTEIAANEVTYADLYVVPADAACVTDC